MSNATVPLWTMLTDARPETATATGWSTFMRFVIRCCHSTDRALPPAAAEGLVVARRFWQEDAGTLDDLAAARAACWTFLHQAYPRQDLTPETAAVRLVITALTPAPSEDDEIRSSVFFAEEMLSELGITGARLADLVGQAG